MPKSNPARRRSNPARTGTKPRYIDVADLNFIITVACPACCDHCGHQIQPGLEPQALSILKMPSLRYSPDIADPAYKAEMARREAVALASWHRSPAARAWAHLKAKPSKAAYAAVKKTHASWEKTWEAER